MPMQQKTNICVIGGSGVGKSTTLKYVLGDTARIDPYRARPDGARTGEDRYVSPAMWQELLRLNERLDENGPRVTLSSNKGDMDPCLMGDSALEQWVKIFTNASFFTVRKDMQVLLHYDFQVDAPLGKVELFAPVFYAILKNKTARDAIPFLQGAKTIFILLNPLATPVTEVAADDVIDKAGWIVEDWIDLQFQRSLLWGELEGLDSVALEKKRAKMAERVVQLPYEVAAWQNLIALSRSEPDVCGFVECLGWTHFEYKYIGRGKAEIRRRAEAAKQDILRAASIVDLDGDIQRAFRLGDDSTKRRGFWRIALSLASSHRTRKRHTIRKVRDKQEDR